MADAILEVRGLSVSYGKVEALHDAHLRVEAGQIVTVIGPNGAGKSTMLNAIMGALPRNGSSRGEVLYLGADVSAAGIETRVAQGMCLVPEKRELFGTMSVEDNLLLGAYRRKRAGERNFLDQMEAQFKGVLRLQPWIISNGAEDGWMMPSHLTTMGFYILRVRSNLVDIKAVLQQ